MPPQRRYICSFCARPFSRSEHKARHERSHTKEKPFHCDQCDSCFVRRDLLQRHLRTVHAKGNNKQQHHHHEKKDDKVATAPSITTTTTTTTFNYDNLFQFNEQNIISLLTLSKKFNNLPLHLQGKTSSSFLTWGTISNNNLPCILNDQLLNLSFDSSLLYSILAFGSIDSNNTQDSIKLINKSWSLILKNEDPLGNIQSLTIISYIYLHHYNKLKSNPELIPIEIIMDYLDQTTSKVINSHSLFNYWYIFLILSKFSFQWNKSPSKSHSHFLSKTLPSGSILSDQLAKLSTSSNDFPKDDLTIQCIVAALSNELQSLKFNTPNQFVLKDLLHNAIIMTNKAFTNSSNLSQAVSGDHVKSPTLDSTTTKNSSSINNGGSSPKQNLILISKRNLLLNCPLKFQDLIMDYITPPTSSTHWQLLQITLREFNMEYNPTSLTNLTSLPPHLAITTLQNYLSNLRIRAVNNNLGITSMILLFLGFLGIKIDEELKGFVLEDYLCLISVFEGVLDGKKREEWDNPVVQALVYLIREMGSVDHSENGHDDSNGSTDTINGSRSVKNIDPQPTPQLITLLISNIKQNLSNWLISQGCHSDWCVEVINGLGIISPLNSVVNSPKSMSMTNGVNLSNGNSFTNTTAHNLNNGISINNIGSNGFIRGNSVTIGALNNNTEHLGLNKNLTQSQAHTPKLNGHEYDYSGGDGGNYSSQVGGTTSPRYDYHGNIGNGVALQHSYSTQSNQSTYSNQSLGSTTSGSIGSGSTNYGSGNGIKLPPINVLKQGAVANGVGGSGTGKIMLPDRFTW